MSTVKPERLLIADDEPDLLTAYVLFFDAYGYEIRTARDGLDALAQYRGWRPEIVVLDIQMPRLDGRAVAKEIRNLKAKPVPLLVAVSALSAPSELAGSIQSGFDHHFVKPVQLPVILAAMASWRRARSATRSS
jgi:CheY-like chemotaxis protein